MSTAKQRVRRHGPPPPATSIAVPTVFATEIDILAKAFAARTGEPLDAARRLVEVTVLHRGIASLKAEQAEQQPKEGTSA